MRRAWRRVADLALEKRILARHRNRDDLAALPDTRRVHRGHRVRRQQHNTGNLWKNSGICKIGNKMTKHEKPKHAHILPTSHMHLITVNKIIFT